MVSKTSTATGVTKKSTAPAAKKTAKKPATKKASTATVKNEKINLVDKQVPVKENVNPVEKVLEIKAKNESKKSAPKAVAKSVRKAEVKAPVASKKPVAEEKKCPCCTGKCKDGICATWARAYRNMFNFKGRASRYEFWGFMLLNFIFAIVMTSALVAFISTSTNTILTAIGLGGMLAFIVIEIFTYLSLSVRRLHDAGNCAWKGFFKPVIFSFILFALLSIGCFIIINHLGEQLFTIDLNMQLCLLAYLLLFFVVFIFLIYYTTKTAIIASFFDEDDDNVYGDALYADKLHKVKAFKYAILYFLLVTITNLIIEPIVSYMNYAQY